MTVLKPSSRYGCAGSHGSGFGLATDPGRGKGKHHALGSVLGEAFGRVFALLMDVAVEQLHVFEGLEQREGLRAVLCAPVPGGVDVDQRPMREDDDLGILS